MIAAEQVLEKYGDTGLTTNRVADVAGVSIGTLYQYFPNKQALVAAIEERYLFQTLGLIRAALIAAEGVPIATLIDRTTEAVVAAYDVRRPIHRCLIDLRTVSASQERYRRALDELVAEIAAFLAARPDVHLPDPHAAAYVVVHAVDGVVAATSVRRGHNVRAIAATTSAMVRAYVTLSAPDTTPAKARRAASHS